MCRASDMDRSRFSAIAWLQRSTQTSAPMSRAISTEIVYLAGMAVLLNLIICFLLLRDIRLTMLAFIPVLSSVLLILGITTALGLSLNAPGILATMIVLGLSDDFGIFMVYQCLHDHKTGTRQAVSLSLLTTFMGAGVLLFARHPLLSSIGVTLMIGLGGGYVASQAVVPPCYRLWLKPQEELPSTSMSGN